MSAYGYEALLDTIINPTFDIVKVPGVGVFATDVMNVFLEYRTLQALAGSTPLRAGAGPTGTISNQENPIGSTVNDRAAGGNPVAGFPDVLMAGQSIRQAFETYLKTATLFAGGAAQPVALTVDFYRGIRLFGWGGGQIAERPSDYADLTVTDTAAGAVAAANLTYEEDHSPGAIVNAVYVAMPNAPALNGWVVGDTTTGRREAYLSINGTTEADKSAAAAEVLNKSGTPAGRGSLDLENFVPIAAHPGSKLTVTDANMGWSSNVFLISEISKTFNQNGKQNWHVSFFGSSATPTAGPASAARLIGTLTRGTAA